MGALDKSWIVIIMLIVEVVLAMANKSVDMRSARYNNCILYIINSITGTLAYWGLARKINGMNAKILYGGVQWLSFLSQNAMGFICMNQFFITLFSSLLRSVLTDGIIVIVASKIMTFLLVMITVTWITKCIMNTRFKIILGGR